MTDTNNQWTVATLHEYNEAVRKVEDKFHTERDRRYTEVAIEREKALRIKETADLAALSLARESQTYKEQQNDALRDKNLSESGVYATNASVAQAIGNLETKLDAALTPLINFVAGQKGEAQGSQLTMGKIYAALAAFGTILTVVVFLANQLSK
jgi:hypothetical protein